MTNEFPSISKEFPIHLIVQYGLHALGALAILIGGLLLARWIGNLLQPWLTRHELDPPIQTLFVRTARVIVMLLAILVALDTFGVEVTTLIAGLGAAGVGAGLAVQGVLGNAIAGLQIIFAKPFRAGEYIEIVGVQGKVHAVGLFSTKLVHADQSMVIIPNRKIHGEILHNYGGIRQLALSIGVGYGTNLDAALAMVREIVERNERVLREPAPIIGIAALADSSITIVVQPWVKMPDYLLLIVQSELYQTILERFRKGGVEIPFPQREVRLLQTA